MSDRNRSLHAQPGAIGITLAWLCVLCICGMSLRGTSVHAQNTAPQSKFKNLQVLKDVSPDELIPAMNFIAASLGVQCEFCHVRDAFDKDDKETKKTARRMMQMMFALNANQFNGERAVTCYTCHRGSHKPVSIPMVDPKAPYLSEASAAAAESRTDLPSPEDVVNRYIQALGGAAAIQAVSSRTASGTVSFDAGPGFPIQILSKSPSHQATFIHLAAGDSSTIFDGQNGWLKTPSGSVRDMSRAEIDGAKLDADLQFPLSVKKTFQKLTAVRTEKVNGHDAVLLLAMNPSGPPLELYFDRQTGLLLRQMRFGSSPLGLNPTQIDYDDYKPFDGVQVPMHLVITRPNRTMDIHLQQVAQNAPVDDAKFAHP
jgi:photosynthetic reaction center cytochrome c subunit